MTQDSKELFAELAKPFMPVDIEWRIARAGKKRDGTPWAMVLAYITDRAVQQRLDDVVGPENWRNEYQEWRVGDDCGVLCGISLRINGEWLTKWNGAQNTEIEPVKGGLSDASKRTAVLWGIGRYLYGLTENFAEIVEKGTKDARYCHDKKADVEFYWLPPRLPQWALPPVSVDEPPAPKKTKPKREELPADTAPLSDRPTTDPYAHLSDAFKKAREVIVMQTTMAAWEKSAARVHSHESLTDEEKEILDEVYLDRQLEKINSPHNQQQRGLAGTV